MTGFVDEPEPWFQRGRVFVAPLRFGTGITVKVLNAMSRGIPTVTTSVGTEGLIAEHMTHIAITDTREDMLEAIDELLGNRQTWERLEQNSRALVTEHYTWARVLGDMKSVFDALFMTNDSGVEDRTEGIHHHPELERLAGHH